MSRRDSYRRYSDEFKTTAISLSRLPGVLAQDVAEALDIHPFMLSRWKKDQREGRIVSRKKVVLDPDTEAELKRLRRVEREYKLLQMEHDLLKKAIRFTSERRKKFSNSSK